MKGFNRAEYIFGVQLS